MSRALIAMSGGVDSSVAAYLLKSRGYECIGCTMKLYENEDNGEDRGNTCCSLNDVEDARAVAYRLGMKYYVFNFTDTFRKKVIDNFVRCYECGNTPNPCIDCNRYMKFDRLFQRAKVMDCSYIVTGHYARIAQRGNEFILKKAVDESKDQSYVLYFLSQEQLSHILFPLGTMKKTEIRQIAEKAGFSNAGKPDSQDICFVPDKDYAKMIEKYTGKNSEPGKFVDRKGNVLGKHKGIVYYTIGQRKGLNLSFTKPHYVCDICSESNSVALGFNEDLYKTKVYVSEFHWISGEAPRRELRCKVKIRYRQPEQWATVIVHKEAEVTVVFDEPQRAVTPGQAAVLYDGDTVLGGGIIQNHLWEGYKK